ncbi:type IV pilus twitching motility protein PilT [Telmatospirillum siberiense]|uniref:Type IV pili twitching motility protein PilT n=1 Tax=Telmatospirillum siberiense TaxID=382514 RepID=A0A2N3Q1X6_9PROT|nr:type IV pili twitching motility protein PilT [Telmatospirillum siberiense]
MEITELLAFTLQSKGSDLHLSSGNPPLLRIAGDLKPLKCDPLTADEVAAMLHSVMSDEQRADYQRDHDLDFAIAFGEQARFRVNAFTVNRGPAAVFRTIPTAIPSLDELEAPAIFKQFAELEKGLVLVTGPTGSGKSTTLAAMIDHINRTFHKHILTIEDPVEFVHTSERSLVNHREVGKHTQSFGRALKSALREDPDVILVGEMRDHETISLALTAAETGHLVMGTLHTGGAAKTIDRIIDVFPGSDKDMVRAMLAGSLQAVISQVLLKRTGGGRVAAHDILVGTAAVRNLIRENKVPQIASMMQMGSRYGMQTLEDSVKTLIAQGKIDPAEMDRFMPPGQDRSTGGTSAAPLPATASASTEEAPATPPQPPKRGVTSLFR